MPELVGFKEDLNGYPKFSVRTHLEVHNDYVGEDEILEVGENYQYGVNNITIDGRFYNYGTMRIYGILTVNNYLNNEGTIIFVG